MQIQDKIIPDQKIAVINYKGPISDLEVLLSKLMDWVETEEIKTIGEPFIIYYSPRQSVNHGDAVFDVGIAIEGNAQAKDIIKNLQDQIYYVENPHNDIDEENRDFIVEEANSLIEEIQKEYRNKNNVIGLYNHPMAGFYVLQDKYILYKDLKDYYNELEGKNK